MFVIKQKNQKKITQIRKQKGKEKIAYLKCTIDLKLTTTQSATSQDVATTFINNARGSTNNTTNENTK
jgi:hypothetical protein